jgi:hypothetical protein
LGLFDVFSTAMIMLLIFNQKYNKYMFVLAFLFCVVGGTSDLVTGDQMLLGTRRIKKKAFR